MTQRVLAIGLDGAERSLLEQWSAAGLLPTFARLRAAGAYAHLQHLDACRSETLWTMVLTGCLPQRTGLWLPQRFDAATYTVSQPAPYDFEPIPPFYALGKERRVIAFDIPQSRLSDNVAGEQIVAWGTHSPFHHFATQPAELAAQLRQKYGRHPAAAFHHATLWRRNEVEKLYRALIDGAQRRAELCIDLMQSNAWDLCAVVFAETHLAGHYLWHLHDRDHPHHRAGGDDLLLGAYRAVDEAVGKIVRAAPADTSVVLFSGHGAETNSSDLPSTVFLPELLYRYCFPGQRAFADHSGKELPPIDRQPRRGWVASVWNEREGVGALRRFAGRHLPLSVSYRLDRLLGLPAIPRHPLAGPDGHQPALWYQQAWPQMKAFALPSYSEGYVRINLRGREAHGSVAPEKYAAVCDEISDLLHAVVDARSGLPLVERIVRPRQSPQENDPLLPDPDLIVVWRARPVDVVRSSRLGQIGPLPFHRAGSHSTRGFALVQGPGFAAGATLKPGRPLDVAPTILGLLGLKPPVYMDGVTLMHDH